VRAALLSAWLLGLTGCAHVVQSVAFPTLPDLSAETRTPCPAAAPVTGQLGDLATKDAALAIEYARCQARAATAVGAYETAQGLLQAAQDAADRRRASDRPAKPR
jgi:hypothetical protein